MTNDKNILMQFRNIKTINVQGVGGNGPACKIVGYGYINLTTDDGDKFPIKVYYSSDCCGTILSPNAIVRDNCDQFTSTRKLATSILGKDV